MPHVQVLLATQVEALLEQGQRAVELAPPEPDETGEGARDRLRVRLVSSPGSAARAVGEHEGSVELTELGEREPEPSARGDVGDIRLTALVLAWSGLEGVHVLSEHELRTPVVPLRGKARAEIAAGQRLQG